MLTTDWKVLAGQATAIYDASLAKTLELFPLADDALKTLASLPSARGSSVTDFGTPAAIPIDLYNQAVPAKVLEITAKDPFVLLGELKAGKYTCVEVLTAYFHAAIFASKLVNCVYEFLPVEALELAKKLDSGSKDLPLFGLPVSLKEMIPFVGRSVTHGSLCYLDRVVDYNADIVNIVIANGAVPFVRTTNPQSLMMLECESYAHGRTVNPYNSTLTSGGSSGGEGAINGIGASTFGFGSDIGGSIRCPLAFNGIYGFRTTSGRLPTADYFSCQLGSESILSVTGPLTRSLDLLNLVMKVIIDSKPWLTDPTLVLLEWKSPPKKFKVAILDFDGVVMPQPPIIRALNLVKEKLLKIENIEVVPFKPYDHAKAWEIISTLYFEDGGQDTRSTVEGTGEPLCPQTEWVISNGNVKPLDMHELWHWNLQKQKYRKDYLAHWQLSGAPDAVIAPVFPGPACKHRTARYWGYTAQWNLLDYPAIVFPVTKVDTELDKPVVGYKPLNDMDEFVYKEYDSAESFANAPVNLCAVGLRNTEETLVEVARLLRS